MFCEMEIQVVKVIDRKRTAVFENVCESWQGKFKTFCFELIDAKWVNPIWQWNRICSTSIGALSINMLFYDSLKYYCDHILI